VRRFALVSAEVAACTSASAMAFMPATPSFPAFSPRARIAALAMSGGASSGPKSARLRTDLGSSAAM